MNLIAIDIGNTSINVGLFLKGQEKFVKSCPGKCESELTECIISAWEQIPVAKRSKEKKRDGVIVASSVKSAWTKLVEKIAEETLGQKLLIIGKEVPYPMDLSIKEPDKVGSDRVLSAAAAYAVTEEAAVVADFGTAVTIDLIDDRGVFCGGVICPGFEISAKTLQQSTAQLPRVTVSRPKLPFGQNTAEAINAGLYYSAVGTLQEMVRRYAEKIGTWPKTIITGAGAEIIKEDCEFVDSYVPNMVIKGIALAYRKYLERSLV
ncbi:MAG: type III pantothenate kinase [Sedimentisphaerales bacterium]|nr:type III pantothenate kinase [Sedimentisphaerales bacterium]